MGVGSKNPPSPFIKGGAPIRSEGFRIGTMKRIIATINKQSQVTIPAAVRRVLGVEPGDKVTFVIEGKEICLARAAFTLESAYGSLSHREGRRTLNSCLVPPKMARLRRTGVKHSVVTRIPLPPLLKGDKGMSKRRQR